MKRSTLELLCCPNCQTELTLRDESGNKSGDEGELFCAHCKRSYIIKNGIVHFIDLQELEGLNQRFARFYNRFIQGKSERLRLKILRPPDWDTGGSGNRFCALCFSSILVERTSQEEPTCVSDIEARRRVVLRPCRRSSKDCW